MYTQTHGQTDRQKDRHTNMQRDKKARRPAHGDTQRHTAGTEAAANIREAASV